MDSTPSSYCYTSNSGYYGVSVKANPYYSW